MRIYNSSNDCTATSTAGNYWTASDYPIYWRRYTGNSWEQYSSDPQIISAPPIITSPIILRRRQSQIERAAAEAARRDEERNAADQRARVLLLANLSPEQRETFERHNWFVVEGGRSGQRYRINGDRLSANIDVLSWEGGQRTHRLCAHCAPGSIPQADQLLAQKFMLEADETEFLRIANRHS